MLQSISPHLGTLLVAALVLLASAGALRSVLHSHQEGGCGSCGGNCEHCGQRKT